VNNVTINSTNENSSLTTTTTTKTTTTTTAESSSLPSITLDELSTEISYSTSTNIDDISSIDLSQIPNEDDSEYK